jgi:parallel beta-helix repeat protein
MTSLVVTPSVSEAALRTINCSTSSCLTNALANAQAGDSIVLAASTTFTGNFKLTKNGTSTNPIIIKSSSTTSKAILNGGGTGSGYVLHITGDHVKVQHVKITNGKKGVMLDNANNCIIEGIEVYNIGEEGVHFRDGSSNNTIKNSTIRDTGTVTPDYGEGVYVGSDVGKWGEFKKETNNNRISYVTFGPNVRAEHIDIKEGSSGTTVEFSTFNGTGITGANFSDSFIDVKGNNNIIKNNTAYRNGNSKIVDAFQVHERATGWGFNNDFRDNTVYLDNSTPYVVNVASGSAKVKNNTRSPSGNMYKGNYTTY